MPGFFSEFAKAFDLDLKVISTLKEGLGELEFALDC